jgi:hypothetical protein
MQNMNFVYFFQETKSWPESLIAGVPARTGFKLKES